MPLMSTFKWGTLSCANSTIFKKRMISTAEAGHSPVPNHLPPNTHRVQQTAGGQPVAAAGDGDVGREEGRGSKWKDVESYWRLSRRRHPRGQPVLTGSRTPSVAWPPLQP